MQQIGRQLVSPNGIRSCLRNAVDLSSASWHKDLHCICTQYIITILRNCIIYIQIHCDICYDILYIIVYIIVYMIFIILYIYTALNIIYIRIHNSDMILYYICTTLQYIYYEILYDMLLYYILISH